MTRKSTLEELMNDVAGELGVLHVLSFKQRAYRIQRQSVPRSPMSINITHLQQQNNTVVPARPTLYIYIEPTNILSGWLSPFFAMASKATHRLRATGASLGFGGVERRRRLVLVRSVSEALDDFIRPSKASTNP
jgi:hypothetical protein